MERKLATVLFVDLVDSTEFVSETDPEVVRRRGTTFFDGVADCIEFYGGTRTTPSGPYGRRWQSSTTFTSSGLRHESEWRRAKSSSTRPTRRLQRVRPSTSRRGCSRPPGRGRS